MDAHSDSDADAHSDTDADAHSDSDSDPQVPVEADAAGGMPGGDDVARFDRVSAGLKEAFAVLGSAEVPDADKPDLHRRLIAITNSAKHDLPTAEKRLAGFWAALPQGAVPAAGEDERDA